ncbi:MAG: chorismate-binding protein, partial [Asticcacaulis sp.]|nr:chorismate-binding protein [Asticcacaulis sp.]
RDGKLTIRPIAGTRPRGKTASEDKALEAELLADPKELSEHLMLLDLGRNDVGRVAKPASVRVTEKFTIERYSHVMHIVSNVEGDAPEGLDPVDALLAALPAGTLSGAPKVRAMEIIDELESVKRGVAYAGGVGYISSSGTVDVCIVLRTALFKDQMIYVEAGAGVVADSVPQTEYEETCHKAGALIKAAQDAWRYIYQSN